MEVVVALLVFLQNLQMREREREREIDRKREREREMHGRRIKNE